MNTTQRVLSDKTLETRLWAKVAKGGPAECWLWTGSASGPREGFLYGQIKVGGKHGKMVKAHRIMAILRGDDIEGRVVMHTCDNPLCVNPAHLVVATQVDNMRDMFTKGRANSPVGERNVRHAFTDEQAADVRARLSNGEPPAEIARSLGIRHQVIHNIAARKSYRHVAPEIEHKHYSYAVAARSRSAVTEADVAAMRTRYLELRDAGAVAREFGVSNAVAYRAITGIRWSGDCCGVAPVAVTKINRISRRLMTDEQAAACKADIRAGVMDAQQIAQKYGVSRATIYAISAGRSYSWVT